MLLAQTDEQRKYSAECQGMVSTPADSSEVTTLQGRREFDARVVPSSEGQLGSAQLLSQVRPPWTLRALDTGADWRERS